MKKIIASLFAFTLLLGCASKQTEYTIVREEIRPTETRVKGSPRMAPVATPENTLVKIDEEPQVQAVQPEPVAPETSSYYVAPSPDAALATPSLVQPIPTYTQEVYVQAPVAAPDLTYSTYVPVQEIALADSVQNPSIPDFQPAPTILPTVTEEVSLVVLQHPLNRDLVKCAGTDQSCISTYEQQGYVQLFNAPQFAGSKDVQSDQDYPAEKWRENNNIPRW